MSEIKEVDLDTYVNEVTNMLNQIVEIQEGFSETLKGLVHEKVMKDTFSTTDELVKQLLEYVIISNQRDQEWKNDMDFVVNENFTANKLAREIIINAAERDRSRISALEKGKTIISAWLIANTVLFVVNIAITLGVFYVQP